MRAYARAADVDRVALIAVEQQLVGSVGVHVDQPGRDGRPVGDADVARAVVAQHRHDPAFVYSKATVLHRAVADSDFCRAEDIGVSHAW